MEAVLNEVKESLQKEYKNERAGPLTVLNVSPSAEQMPRMVSRQGSFKNPMKKLGSYQGELPM